MGIIRRTGEWTLYKAADGLFEVRESGRLRARIVTRDYHPGASHARSARQAASETIEVTNFAEAEREFMRFVQDARRSWSGLGP